MDVHNLLVAGMALVVVARNGILFLVAWEDGLRRIPGHVS
jgi:hypothetical protein